MLDIRKTLGLPDLLDVRKAICIQPHPDDNEVSMGGTVAALRDRECEIVYITVTNGESGSPDGILKGEALAQVRRQEIEAAGEILGVTKQITLGYPDAMPYAVDDVVADLVSHFRREQPDIVFTADPWMMYEAHPDHIKTGQAVAQAVLFSGNRVLFSENPPFDVKQIAFYNTSYPNAFINVTPFWEKKMAALFAHQSQFGNEDGKMVEMFLTLQAEEIAKSKGWTGFGESFKVLASQQLHCMPSTVFN